MSGHDPIVLIHQGSYSAMPNNTEAQRRRRLARRRCGGCGGPAAFMRYWRGALVPICAGCAEKLASEGTESRDGSQAAPRSADATRARLLHHPPAVGLRPKGHGAAGSCDASQGQDVSDRRHPKAGSGEPGAVRKMMASFEAAHMGGEGVTPGGAGARADPARGGGAASRDAGAERDCQGNP